MVQRAALRRALVATLIATGATASLGATTVTLPFDTKRYALAELQIEEARMNAYYAQIAGRLDRADSRSLAAEQQKWKAYRERRCDLAGRDYEGGSAQPLVVTSCFGRLTKARADELESEMTCTDRKSTCEQLCNDADGKCIQKRR